MLNVITKVGYCLVSGIEVDSDECSTNDILLYVGNREPGNRKICSFSNVGDKNKAKDLILKAMTEGKLYVDVSELEC